jgi:hypothetical protein
VSAEDFENWFLSLSLERQRQVVLRCVQRITVNPGTLKFETVFGDWETKRALQSKPARRVKIRK